MNPNGLTIEERKEGFVVDSEMMQRIHLINNPVAAAAYLPIDRDINRMYI